MPKNNLKITGLVASLATGAAISMFATQAFAINSKMDEAQMLSHLEKASPAMKFELVGLADDEFSSFLNNT